MGTMGGTTFVAVYRFGRYCASFSYYPLLSFVLIILGHINVSTGVKGLNNDVQCVLL